MKKSKIFSTVAIIIAILITISNFALAYDPDNIKPNTGTNASNQVKTVGEKILGIVQIVGTTASIITLIVLGIKYMTGSVEEKAEYKKTLMPYLIGAIFVLAATNITKWIYDASSGFFSGLPGTTITSPDSPIRDRIPVNNSIH